MLEVSSDENTLLTTYGELCPPLGKHRLKIVEFVAVLLGTGDEAAENKLVSSGTIQKILNLFFEYPFNNSLHLQVESILTTCLYSKNNTLIDHLFQDCDIIEKFLKADKYPNLSSDSNLLTKPAAGRKTPRAGYIGHITRIANMITQLANCNDHIQKSVQENSEWKDWESNVLHARNEVENVCRWACGRPAAMQRTRDSDEDDVNDRDYDISAFANNLSQVFRCNSYDNDNDDADEEAYFDDESAEVVISSLRLGDDNESNLFTNSNWFAFQDDNNMEEPFSTSTLDRMEDISLSNGDMEKEANSSMTKGPQNVDTFHIQVKNTDSDECCVPNGLEQVDDVNIMSTSGIKEETGGGEVSSMFEEDAEFVTTDLESSKSFDNNNSLEIEIQGEDKHGDVESDQNHMLLSSV